MAEVFVREVLSASRLAALRRLGILDTPAEMVFDRLGELASRVLQAPIALVTLVDDTRQFFKSCRGLPEPWATWRESPLSYSFCQHVLVSSEPLVIEDARQHAQFAENLATLEWSVVGYLGIPLRLEDGCIVGSFCVIDRKPRAWTPEEIDSLSILARAATAELELRAEMKRTAETNQQLTAANEDLRTFTFSVAHDLRSHLGRLQSYLELVVDESAGLKAEAQLYLQAVQRSTRQIATLFDGLLSLAKASTQELMLLPVDLSTIAAEVAAELRHGEPQRQVTVEIEPNLVARADPALARLLLQNLIGNAWKFTARRSDARIEFGATRVEDGVCFQIRDNGVGFPPEQAEQLFRPFHRLHSSREFPGSGLGLQGAKRIVERHGGKISAEGAPDGGAVFRFSLAPPASRLDRATRVQSMLGADMPGQTVSER